MKQFMKVYCQCFFQQIVQQNSNQHRMNTKNIVILTVLIFTASSINSAFQSIVNPRTFVPFSQFSFNVIYNSERTQKYEEDKNEYRPSRLVYLPNGDYLGGSISTLNLFGSYSGLSGSDSIGKLRGFARRSDGKYNNQQQFQSGSSQVALSRHCPPLYKDGISEPMDSDFTPRITSNSLGKVTYPIKLNPDNVTMAFTIWGQFIDHDIGLTEVHEEETMNIKIPKCDPFMDIDCEGNKQIPFKRSLFMPGGGPRDQMNSITSWIDGSMIYGSTKEVSDRLRQFQLGRMKERNGKMLPLKENDEHGSLDAGDVRANENLILLSYHTIFMREHNRLCKLIISKHPTLSDEEIYQTARNYVIGLIQKITFEDFLPTLLGEEVFNEQIGSYKKYDPSVDGNIQIEMTTAAYRFGHALLVSQFPLIDRYGDIKDKLILSNMFFRPDLLKSETMENLLRGLAKTIAKDRNGEVIDEVRNLLITAPEDRHIFMDLYALNVQRARDHGLERFNYIRVAYGLPQLRSFTELTGDYDRAKLLEDFYHDINNVDPWVGILNEKSLPGAIVGELGAKIIAFNFKKLRNGDRFWYEEDYPPSIISQIKTTSFSEVIMRNSGILELQQDIFHYHD